MALTRELVYPASPPGSTNIHALDSYLFSVGRHHASTISALNARDVIEIQGPPGSGKTHLLYQLVIASILPIEYFGTKMYGWGKAALVFDTDGTFDIQRLHNLLLSRSRRLLSVESAERLTRIVLRQVHIFRPTSSVQLAMSLTNIPAYHSAQLPDNEIGLLAIDSISSFYWPDRFTFEQMNFPAQTGQRRIHASGALHHVLVALQNIRLSHGPVIALTNWGLSPLTKPAHDSGPTTLYKQHLLPFPVLDRPDELNASTTVSNIATSSPTSGGPLLPLTHHITLPFVTVPPFGANLSLKEVKDQESKYRKEIVAKGEVVGIVRTSGTSRVGQFTFRIGEEEVILNVRDDGK